MTIIVKCHYQHLKLLILLYTIKTFTVEAPTDNGTMTKSKVNNELLEGIFESSKNFL